MNRKAELSVLNGCALWGARVVIPLKGQEIILKQLHEGHPVTTKMKALACSFVWWPGLDSTIEDCVRNCSTCQDHRASPSRAPLYPWEWPNCPWARIHMDHAGPFLGHLFLIVVDAHSKSIEAHIVSSTSTDVTIHKFSTDVTIHKLQQIFATHGTLNRLSVTIELGLQVLNFRSTQKLMVFYTPSLHLTIPHQME